MRKFAIHILAICGLFACLAGTTGHAADWIYFTRDGDTLWDLCLKYTNKRGCWIELGKYNQVRNDRRMALGTEIRIPIGWLKQVHRVGEVRSLSGTVSYSQWDNGHYQPIAVGQSLQLGSRIKTDEGSVTLAFDSGDEVFLRPGSSLRLLRFSTGLTEGRVAEMELDQGTAEATVEPKPELQHRRTGRRAKKITRFQIYTPAAIAAVRGTEFRVVSSAGGGATMRGEVISGLLEVAAGEASTDVPAGFGVSASKGEAPSEPRQLLPAPEFVDSSQKRNNPVSLAWQADPLASAWTLDVYQPGEAGELLSSHQLAAASMHLPDMEETCYEIAVRAIDDEGFNGLENRRPLCIVPPVQVPVLDPLKDGLEDSVLASWSPVDTAAGYIVEVAADQDFKQIISAGEVNSAQLVLAGIEEQTFYVRVKALGNDGIESAYSDTKSYTREGPLPFYTWILTSIILVLAAL